MTMTEIILVSSAFLASLVEGVEALTVVLATGTTRSWRSTLIGVGAALLALSAVIIVLGSALAFVPLDTLRIVVGGLNPWWLMPLLVTLILVISLWRVVRKAEKKN